MCCDRGGGVHARVVNHVRCLLVCWSTFLALGRHRQGREGRGASESGEELLPVAVEETRVWWRFGQVRALICELNVPSMRTYFACFQELTSTLARPRRRTSRKERAEAQNALRGMKDRKGGLKK